MTHGPSRLLSSSLLALFLGIGFSTGPILAAPPQAPKPPADALLSIVIDDLGHSLHDGRRVIALPAPVSLAILPHAGNSATLAVEAHTARKEVLLHLPMDADDGDDTDPGPGRLEMQMSAPEISAMLTYDLQTVPHAVGVNNHMGSRVTQSRAAMDALMSAIQRRGNLLFLDSRTSPHSVAARVAAEHGVSALERDVFLDHDRGDENVWRSIQRTERLLRSRGHAIVIGHPYPETLAALERWLPSLAARGIRVVPLSVMLTEQKRVTDHAERSPSPRSGL